jgi:hypothetical protein
LAQETKGEKKRKISAKLASSMVRTNPFGCTLARAGWTAPAVTSSPCGGALRVTMAADPSPVLTGAPQTMQK